MGNAHTSGKGPLEYTPSMMKGYPMLFHENHSLNIQLSPDKRRAKRVESFCKGICFGNRPVAINERVYIKFAEISTSWSGVLRFGFTAHEPGTLNREELPRYACPDLTNKPGFWAKALPERVAVQGNILFFYVTPSGDCKFGVNDEEKGLFFNGIDVKNFFYPLVDIYGNTTSMEFVDGRQINSHEVSQLHHSLSVSQSSLPTQAGMVPATPPQHLTHTGLPHARSVPTTPVVNSGQPIGSNVAAAGASPGQLPIIHHASYLFTELPFHQVIGRSVCLSPDKTVAVRLVEEFCNAYVFSNRPLQCGEKLVIQILSIDRTFCGGITFGMTACDPSMIIAKDLPDDSDNLLDRPEYWVVNKDVCTNPEIGDELSFFLTHEGQVIYGRNGHNIATLMHIDKTLPMWPFFDIYGSTQKIKCIGVTMGQQQQGDRSVLQVSLPPSRNDSSSSLASLGSSGTVPPRPPPPRTSPGSMKISPRNSPGRVRSAGVAGHESSPPPPTLPPKQSRPHGASPQLARGLPSGAAAAAAGGVDLNLPPPLIPMPPTLQAQQHTTPQSTTAPTMAAQSPASTPSSTNTSPKKVAPAIPPRTIDQWHRKTVSKSEVAISPPPGDQSQEAVDNASNECCVCLENPPNSVLYTCGHMCMCYECARDIQQNQGGLCPMCRNPIKDIIKIFRS